MATPTLLSTGILAQVVPDGPPTAQLGMLVAAIACATVLAVLVQVVRAMAQAVGTLLRTVAPIFVAVAGTGAVLVLAGVLLAAHP